MQNPSGAFIVIEGADGSGKSTQFNILKARLEAIGHDVDLFKFPQHNEPSGYFVRKYLNGGYGPIDKISPYTASLFYALDRFEGAPAIRKSMQDGHIALSDRYVGANMAHQGSKFTNPAEQRGFFVWEDGLEFELLNIPRPTLTIFLHVPAEISQKLLSERARKTGVALDEHEKNVEHLKTTVSTYEKLCQLFPKDFKSVECAENGKLLSVPEINNRIWEIVKPILPAKPSKPAHSVTVKLSEVPAPKKEALKAEVKRSPTKELNTKLTLAAILETRLNGLNVKPRLDWSKAGYEYLKPEGLPKKTAAKYEQLMDDFVDLHRSMRSKLKKSSHDLSLLDSALPLAAALEVRVMDASESQLSSLSDNNKNSSNTKEPEAINQIIARMASEHLPQSLAQPAEEVELVEARPRNEFKVLADAMYPFSNLSKLELETEIDSWNYQQKSKALEAALTSNETEVAAKLCYQFDLSIDYQLLTEVITSHLADEIKLQPATPRYGYEVLKEVDDADITDEYLECFDKSLELYSTLQAAGRDDLAPYATLTGHKNRCHVVCSLDGLRKAKKQAESKQLAALISAMMEKISEHHPIVAASFDQPEPKPPAATRPSRKSRRRRSGKSKKS